MIGILPGIPPNVAGFKASGEVTREDYENVVFPEIRRHVERYGHLNFVFYVDTPLKNFSAGAWIRDIWLGLKELARWHKVAIISDVENIRRFTDTVSRLLPGEYKGFPAIQLDDAIRWAASEAGAPSADIPDYIEALLPKQVSGEERTTAAEVNMEKEEDARYVFERASERLLDINQWTDMCLSVSFQLTDDRGHRLDGRAAVNDFIRIDLPGHHEDRGQLWVQIERVEEPVSPETDQLFLMQIHRTPAPGAGNEMAAEDMGTSTFVLERKAKHVSLTVYGRNKVVATSVIGLSKSHWKTLVHGLLSKE